VKVEYVHLFNSDDGRARFEDLAFEFAPSNFAPLAPPVDVSDSVLASAFMMLRIPAGWTDSAHPAPARQFAIMVAGKVQITASGETRTLTTGDVLLVEDTSGPGHTFTAIEDALIAIVRL
jgi:quercetin dioxygenase-like cupin family protein